MSHVNSVKLIVNNVAITMKRLGEIDESFVIVSRRLKGIVQRTEVEMLMTSNY